MSLRGQGEGRHRRSEDSDPGWARGYDDEEDEEERGGRRACGLAGAQVPAHPAPAWGGSTLLLSTHMGASKLTVRSPQAEASAAASMPSGWEGRQGPWHSAHPQFSPWQ